MSFSINSKTYEIANEDENDEITKDWMQNTYFTDKN